MLLRVLGLMALLGQFSNYYIDRAYGDDLPPAETNAAATTFDENRSAYTLKIGDLVGDLSGLSYGYFSDSTDDFECHDPEKCPNTCSCGDSDQCGLLSASKTLASVNGYVSVPAVDIFGLFSIYTTVWVHVDVVLYGPCHPTRANKMLIATWVYPDGPDGTINFDYSKSELLDAPELLKEAYCHFPRHVPRHRIRTINPPFTPDEEEFRTRATLLIAVDIGTELCIANM